MNTLQKLLEILKKSTKSAKSSTENSAQDTASNSQSLTIEREAVLNSPFTIVGTKKNGYWLTMGKHRLTNIHKTKKEVQHEVDKMQWSLITSVIIAFIHDRKLVDQVYSYNTGIPPDEKSQQLSIDLNNK